MISSTIRFRLLFFLLFFICQCGCVHGKPKREISSVQQEKSSPGRDLCAQIISGGSELDKHLIKYDDPYWGANNLSGAEHLCKTQGEHLATLDELSQLSICLGSRGYVGEKACGTISKDILRLDVCSEKTVSVFDYADLEVRPHVNQHVDVTNPGGYPEIVRLEDKRVFYDSSGFKPVVIPGHENIKSFVSSSEATGPHFSGRFELNLENGKIQYYGNSPVYGLCVQTMEGESKYLIGYRKEPLKAPDYFGRSSCVANSKLLDDLRISTSATYENLTSCAYRNFPAIEQNCLGKEFCKISGYKSAINSVDNDVSNNICAVAEGAGYYQVTSLIHRYLDEIEKLQNQYESLFSGTSRASNCPH